MIMLKKINERKQHLYILTFLLGLFLGISRPFLASTDEPAHKYLDYFHQVYQIIKTDYVDRPANKELFYGAIKGTINSLDDPYSRFLDENDFSQLQEETSGKFVGVGIEITIKDGEVVVISPIEDTPAMKAGIKAGDTITRVDNTSLKNKGIADIVKLIKGLPHTKVKLHVRREGFDKLLEFEIERLPIKIETLNYAIMKQHKIGYLKLKVFNSSTQREVEKALNYFNKQNIQKLIIDLRWNPGGLLDKSIQVSDMFLEKGKVIVSTKGREGTGNIIEFKSQNDSLYKGKLMVLVNEGSASASEIFSGAIKDNKRGKLVGQKTFGKGLVQKVFSLDKNIGISLTIARYYTPLGESIHGKGILPDHIVPMKKISDEDKDNIALIYKKKLPELFTKTHKKYNDENVKQFMEFLKKRNLEISNESASIIFRSEVYRYSKRPLYDLKFDNQLKRSVDIINEV